MGCVCLCVCMHVCVHLFTCTCVCEPACVCMHVCQFVSMCVHEQLRPDIGASRQPRQQTDVPVLAVSRPVTASPRAPRG